MPSGKFLSSAGHRSRVNRSSEPGSDSTVVMLSTFSWRPEAAAGQRIRNVGEASTADDGAVRANHVVEFEERRRIAW